MKQVLSIAVLLSFLLASCSILPKKRCWKEGYVQHDSTWFPKPKLDYMPSEVQARVAVPLNGKLRIWVKGSREYNRVQAIGISNLGLKKLEGPFYTMILTLPDIKGNSVTLQFFSEHGSQSGPPIEKKLYLSNVKNYNSQDSAFSIMFYGCFQPFQVDANGNPELLHDTDNPLNYDMRRLFEAIALGQALKYYPDGKDSLDSAILVKYPGLIIATGDQIYVDAGYETKDFRRHALTGWAHGCKEPYPLFDEAGYQQHLYKCYTHFYSFRLFDTVFSRIPSIGVWDDHEIRDGWGSHGDEYSRKSGEMSQKLKPFFEIAKQAYIENQYSLGTEYDTKELISGNKSLEQQLEYKGVPVFAFDLRSNRDIYRCRAIDEVQMSNFKTWCAQQEAGKEVLLISSIPFFYKPNKPVKLLGRLTQPGLRDDINDGWHSKYNRAQRNEILLEIIKLRDRGVKPVFISGDAHLGGMISAWYDAADGEKKRLCYEFIYSGLSHEVMGEERSWLQSVLRRRSEGRKITDNTFPIGENQIEYVYEFTETRLNFGNIEFQKDKETTASLFIVGADEEYITQRKMVLNWEENFDSYFKEGISPSSGNGNISPGVVVNRIVRTTQ